MTLFLSHLAFSKDCRRVWLGSIFTELNWNRGALTCFPNAVFSSKKYHPRESELCTTGMTYFLHEIQW